MSPASRMLFAAALISTCSGCGSRPNQVHFILPDGYRGSFVVRPVDPDGIPLVRENGQYLVRVPQDGIVAIKGDDPFQSYLCTASFANGDAIWVYQMLGDTPSPGQVALWDLPTVLAGTRWELRQNSEGNVTTVMVECRYRDGTPINAHWWFVGTEAEWRATDHEARFTAGNRSKEFRQ